MNNFQKIIKVFFMTANICCILINEKIKTVAKERILNQFYFVDIWYYEKNMDKSSISSSF